MNERPNKLFCSFREVKKDPGNRWPRFSHENQGLTVHSWGICPDSRFQPEWASLMFKIQMS